MPRKVFMSHWGQRCPVFPEGALWDRFRQVSVNVCLLYVGMWSAGTCVNKSVRLLLCVCVTCVPSSNVHGCLHVRVQRHASKLKSSCLGYILFSRVCVCVPGQSAAGRGLIE